MIKKQIYTHTAIFDMHWIFFTLASSFNQYNKSGFCFWLIYRAWHCVKDFNTGILVFKTIMCERSSPSSRPPPPSSSSPWVVVVLAVSPLTDGSPKAQEGAVPESKEWAGQCLDHPWEQLLLKRLISPFSLTSHFIRKEKTFFYWMDG